MKWIFIAFYSITNGIFSCQNKPIKWNSCRLYRSNVCIYLCSSRDIQVFEKLSSNNRSSFWGIHVSNSNGKFFYFKTFFIPSSNFVWTMIIMQLLLYLLGNFYFYSFSTNCLEETVWSVCSLISNLIVRSTIQEWNSERILEFDLRFEIVGILFIEFRLRVDEYTNWT